MPSARPSPLARIATAYRTTALVAFNLLVAFVLANLVALPFARAPRVDNATQRSAWLEQHGIEAMRRVYPDLSDAEINKVLLQTGTFHHVYEPFIQFKSEATVLEHTNIHRDGFRLVGKDQGPWPIDRGAYNVFVFGGSTALGSGVHDGQTIPAALQRLLRAQGTRGVVNVYNFATGSHYSTQERIYFEQLVMKGQVPNAVVFVDGLNDFYNWKDEPDHTRRIRKSWTVGSYSLAHLWVRLEDLARSLPLGVVAAKLVTAHRTSGTALAPIGTAHAQSDAAGAYADPQKIDAIVERYFRFKRMAEAVAASFGVEPVFVFQPVPLYKYDSQLRLFPVQGEHRRHEFGYPAMARATQGRDMGANFVWCADIQERYTRPMYVDAVHYNVEMNENVARCIADAIATRGLLAKASVR